MRYVFWQGWPGYIQFAHIRALAELGNTVIWAVNQEITEWRRNVGNPVPDVNPAEIVMHPSEERIKQMVAEAPDDSIHILSDIRRYPTTRFAFGECIRSKVRMGLLTENRDATGWKALGRKVRYSLLAKRFGGRISFLMVMGYTGEHGGLNYFKGCGFPAEKIYPYGYFLAGLNDPIPDPERTESSVNLIFIGQHIPRKGGDLLIESLRHLKQLDWRLVMIGDGRSKHDWIERAKSNGLSDHIEFVSSMPNAATMERLAASDLLILPSRFDGWGCVVNEALLRGVPVVCSDRCGAKELLADNLRGGIFKIGSPRDLTEKLEKRIVAGPLSSATRQSIQDWTSRISGEVAAQYLVRVMESIAAKGKRPTAPWLADSE